MLIVSVICNADVSPVALGGRATSYFWDFMTLCAREMYLCAGSDAQSGQNTAHTRLMTSWLRDMERFSFDVQLVRHGTLEF